MKVRKGVRQVGFQHGMFDIQVGGTRFTECNNIGELRSWMCSSNCANCGFARRRKNIVPGEGSDHSGLAIIGQGPGRVEDTNGRPFIGRSGDLLDRILDSMSLAPPRSDIYITNVVKCYGGRSKISGDIQPQATHINACLPYLRKEMDIVKPTMILAFGSIAWATICDRGEKLINGSLIKNTVFGIPTFLSYHPAWALRKKGQAHTVLRDDIRDAMLMLRQLREEK